MKILDRTSGLFFLVLGFAVFIQGTRLGLKVNSDMGPGFLPTIVGGILVFLSVVLLWQSVLGKRDSEQKGIFWAHRGGWKSVFLTLATAGVYPFTLHYLGFFLATFVFLFFLFLVIARFSWWISGVWGVGTSLVAYLIFEVWLKANLPKGFILF